MEGFIMSGNNSSDNSKVKTHTSLHASGATNHDYSGSSGTVHIHPDKTRWDGNPDANGPLYKDKDGVWREKDGSVFRGGKK